MQGVHRQDATDLRVHVVGTSSGSKWKATNNSLRKFEEAFQGLCSDYTRIGPKVEELDSIDADYLSHFDSDKKRAQPARRKQYDRKQAGASLSITAVYESGDAMEADDESSAEEE